MGECAVTEPVANTRLILTMAALVIAALLAGACAGTLSAAEGDPATMEELIREVRALRQQVEDLQARVEKLEELLANVPGPTTDGPFEHSGPRRRGADREALAKIQLPENPTREEVRRYVDQVMATTAGLSSASSSDPQVAMLRRVGPENIDILLDRLGYPDASMALGNIYIKEAVKALARPQHKELFLESLTTVPELAAVVLRYGWEEDARETLLSEMEARPHYLPREWLAAVGRLGDKEAMDALKDYFIRGNNRETTFGVLRTTPDVGDLRDLVDRAWVRARTGDPYEARQMARIAVGYGHRDALDMLVRSLDMPAGDFGWGQFTRRAILRHTEARGTDEQIVKWYRENRDRLYWDEESRRFRVGTEEPSPTADGEPGAQ